MAVTKVHPVDDETRRAVQRAEREFSGVRRVALLLGGALVGTGVLFGVGGVVAADGPSLVDSLGWIALGGFWLAVALVPPGWWSWLGRRDPRFAEPAVRTLDEDGLHVRGESRAFDLPWSRVRRVRETERFVLLFEGTSAAHHLDKSLLSMDEISEVRRLVKAHQVKRRRSLGLLPPR